MNEFEKIGQFVVGWKEPRIRRIDRIWGLAPSQRVANPLSIFICGSFSQDAGGTPTLPLDLRPSTFDLYKCGRDARGPGGLSPFFREASFPNSPNSINSRFLLTDHRSVVDFGDECQEIVEMLGQNGLEDRSLEVLIAMDGDVAEPDHSFHGIGGLRGDASGLVEERRTG